MLPFLPLGGVRGSSSNAAPLEKGASSSNAAPLEKGEKNILKKRRQQATALEKGQFLEKGNVAKKVAVLESKTATKKQAKSLAKGKEAAALEKGSEKKQSPESQSEPLAVLVDWHNCLKNGPQAQLPEKWSPGHCAGPGPHGPAEAP